MVVRYRIRRGVKPVSSCSSRRAQSRGSSPGSSLPAGISTVTLSSAVRYWRTRTILPDSVRATTAAAPGWRTMSRPVRRPLGNSTSRERTSRILPRHAVSSDKIFSCSSASRGSSSPNTSDGSSSMGCSSTTSLSSTICASSSVISHHPASRISYCSHASRPRRARRPMSWRSVLPSNSILSQAA